MTQAFNLSQLANKVNTSGQLDVATGVTGTQAVANGGTGQSTYTNGQLLIGNTTGNTLTKATLTAGTGISITNSTGSITIASTVSSGGQVQTQLFTAPGTWTCPASTTQVRVTVVGASGGFPGGTGGSSSFGSLVSATGGGPAPAPTTSPGTSGTGTVSTGTGLKVSNMSVIAGQWAFSLGAINGIALRNPSNSPGTPTAVAYSTTATFIAGAQSGGSGAVNGSGGYAIAISPVSAPVAVTVGSGANSPAGPTVAGGVGGAVLVEFVG